MASDLDQVARSFRSLGQKPVISGNLFAGNFADARDLGPIWPDQPAAIPADLGAVASQRFGADFGGHSLVVEVVPGHEVSNVHSGNVHGVHNGVKPDCA